MPEDAGLIWVNSKITRPNDVSARNFLSFYADSHVPDVVQVPGFKSAAVYKANASDAERPYLILYRLSDMKASDSEKLHELFAQEDVISMREKGNFDIREYEPVHSFEEEGAKSEPGRVLVAVMAETPHEAGMDIPKGAASTVGYHCSRRYKLLSAQERGDGATDSKPPAYLALHEFDDSPPEQVERLDRSAGMQEFTLVKHY